MIKLQSKLAEIMSSINLKEGFQSSSISGVHCVKHSKTDYYTKRRWRASLAIVVQGRKEIVLENDVYWCESNNYTVTPVDLPLISKVAEASRENPFLAILIDLDPIILSEVVVKIENEFKEQSGKPLRGIFTGKVSEKMIEAMIRLVNLIKNPEDAVVLGPLIIKEILYRLLKEPNGQAISQFVRYGSKMHKICQVIYQLKSDLKNEIDIMTLSKSASMSRSSFFKYFNEVTSMSPIQYQKRLRLLESKRLMIEEEETAESSAFKVGYKSVSQFSREYSRMFGNPPIKDVMQILGSNKFVKLD